jgi:hypothetical protein
MAGNMPPETAVFLRPAEIDAVAGYVATQLKGLVELRLAQGQGLAAIAAAAAAMPLVAARAGLLEYR